MSVRRLMGRSTIRIPSAATAQAAEATGLTRTPTAKTTAKLTSELTPLKKAWTKISKAAFEKICDGGFRL